MSQEDDSTSVGNTDSDEDSGLEINLDDDFIDDDEEEEEEEEEEDESEEDLQALTLDDALDRILDLQEENRQLVQTLRELELLLSKVTIKK